MEAITIGRIQNPVRGMLHGAAAVGSALGAAVLYDVSAPAPVRAAVVVYSLSLVAMFSTSSLYHALPWSDTWKLRMRRLDHAAIFVFIAGTITPLTVTLVEGTTRTTMLGVVWVGAALGVLVKLREPTVRLGRSIVLQNIIGWLAVIPISQGVAHVGPGPMLGLVVGGLLCVVGMVCFLIDRPRLLPGVFSSHELFHLAVVVAAGIHFYVIAVHLVPLPT